MFEAPAPLDPDAAFNDFIERWQHTTSTEKANYQLFLSELCTLLELPTPDPTSKDSSANAYTFERRVEIHNPDGSENRGFIDLYKRGAFVLKAKQTAKGLETKGWGKAMQAAYNQADQYVRALPTAEGRATATSEASAADKTKTAWPRDLASQVTLLRDMLAANPHSAEVLATQFKRKPVKGVGEGLSALAALGQAQQDGEQWRLVR